MMIFLFYYLLFDCFFFFSSRRRHTRSLCDWSSDVCSSDLNDNTRSGWNDKETALTTSNVNVQQFGAVFTLTVDDQVYAQPLVVGHVSVGGGDRNVVYIATVNNTLYAYDGDNGTLYWQSSFTAP